MFYVRISKLPFVGNFMSMKYKNLHNSRLLSHISLHFISHLYKMYSGVCFLSELLNVKKHRPNRLPPPPRRRHRAWTNPVSLQLTVRSENTDRYTFIKVTVMKCREIYDNKRELSKFLYFMEVKLPTKGSFDSLT